MAAPSRPEPLRLDAANACLWRGATRLSLRKKDFAVLQVLVSCAGQLCAKEALLDSGWPATYVSDTVLKSCISRLRQVLGDAPRAPRYIETVHGRGYRWIAPISEMESPSLGPDMPPVEAPAASNAPDRSPVPTAREAERRQLTVLFCDLVGSTALASQLDLEDYHEVVQAYSETCATVIARYDGHIAQYLGDGLLVYFGYPQAHEDDAQRAVWAGLGLLEAVAALSPSLPLPPGERLSVRLGAHTGPVVVDAVGTASRRESLALGETPNIAARLQSLADPDTLIISATTQALVQGYFRCQALGSHTLRGVPRPIDLYEVQGASGAQSRFEVAAARGLTPLVGRQEELGLLQQRWALATEGEGQVVLLSGEAGIGKSRLAETLCERLTDAPHLRLHYQCSPYHSNSAFYPFLIQLERMIQEPEPLDANPLERLEALLTQASLAIADRAPLLADLLSLPSGDRYPPMQLSPQQQKEQTIEALVALLVGLSQQQPVVGIVEDAHWIDPTSLETLDRMVERVQDARALLVITARPEFVSPWGDHTHVTSHVLNRLSRRQVTAMVERVAGGKRLPHEVVNQILVKTDGMPLFVEELTKTILESGLLADDDAGYYRLVDPLPPLAIPATLQDALMARLDRLEPAAKEVAQMGAVLGREFADVLLTAVSPLPEEALREAVEKLISAGLLFRRGALPDVTYHFKHALVQETAYASMLRQRRRQLHATIAQVLEERFIARVEAEPEVVAHHYTEAGNDEQAIPYWRQAGQQAMQRSAETEATGHLTQGLALLKSLPQTPERTQQELTLQTLLSSALVVTKGQGAHEVRVAYDRAWELCQRVGDSSTLASVLRGLWMYYLQQEEVRTTRELAEQFLALVESQRDLGSLTEAYRMLGTTSYWVGDFVAARDRFEQALFWYDRHRRHALAVVYGADPGVSCLCYKAWVSWHLGYPDQALQYSQETIALAREASHLPTLALALSTGAWTRNYRRESQAAYELAEEAISLSTSHEFPHWVAMGRWMRGLALVEQGQQSGIAELQQGVEAYWNTGAVLSRSSGLAEVAKACGKVGQPDVGLQRLAKALAWVNETGIGHYEAEIHRLQGELLLQASSGAQHVDSDSATCFHRALAVARRQQARSLELRAAMSLARLWLRQGKRQAAHDLLAPVYGWFTEGFDTTDLKEAKALLATLRA